jgi:hypothetical protein
MVAKAERRLHDRVRDTAGVFVDVHEELLGHESDGERDDTVAVM